jgi:hypothetical protein
MPEKKGTEKIKGDLHHRLPDANTVSFGVPNYGDKADAELRVLLILRG